MDANGREWGEGNREWTRMDANGERSNREWTRMDANKMQMRNREGGQVYQLSTIKYQLLGNREWTRMGRGATATGREWGEEQPRMDANGRE